MFPVVVSTRFQTITTSQSKYDPQDHKEFPSFSL
jgi:hypothetical protein